MERTLAVVGVISNRNAMGWSVFQSDETWQYITRPELGTVCPLCDSHSGNISGDQIPLRFPHYTYNPATPFVARPRTHQPDLTQFFHEECHCDLFWLNPLETLEKRLHAEKEAVL